MPPLLLLLKHSFLFVIPLITLAVAVTVRSVFTPYFLSNYDPDYAYLFNSLSILDLVAPAHVDHPGTPVQLLGALVLKFMHSFGSAEQIIREVIENPEQNLFYISNVLIGLNVGALYFAGLITYKLTKQIGMGLLAQISPLMFPVTIISLGKVTPEPLLMCVSSVLVCLLALSHNMTQGTQEMKLAKYFGWVSGFGVATKLTFIPVAFLPLMALSSKILRKTYALYFFIGAFVFTSAFLLYPKLYYSFLRWLLNLFLGSGIYGQGGQTIINPHSFFPDLLRVSLDQPLYLGTVLIAIVVYLITLKKPNGTHNQNMFQPSLLFGLIIIHLIAILVVAKHPQSVRYLIPSLGLSGFTLVLSILSLKCSFPNIESSKLLLQVGVIVVGIMGAIFLGNQFVGVIDKLREDGDRLRTINSKRATLVASQYSQCAQVHRDSGTQTFAIFFGLQWSRQSDSTRQNLEKIALGKQAFTYDPNRNVFFKLNGDQITLKKIRENHPCIIMLAYSGNLEVL